MASIVPHRGTFVAALALGAFSGVAGVSACSRDDSNGAATPTPATFDASVDAGSDAGTPAIHLNLDSAVAAVDSGRSCGAVAAGASVETGKDYNSKCDTCAVCETESS